MEHTKEPWIAGGKQMGEYPIFADRTDLIHCIGTTGNEADARRIVLCVNACLGIDPELIISEGLMLVGSHNAEVAVLNAKVREVERKRDELLAALEGMLAIHTEPAGFDGKYGKELDQFLDTQQRKIDVAVEAATTAIAKVKGGAK